MNPHLWKLPAHRDFLKEQRTGRRLYPLSVASSSSLAFASHNDINSGGRLSG